MFYHSLTTIPSINYKTTFNNNIGETIVCLIPHQTNQPPLWRHQMETFSAWLTVCAGNSPVIGGFSSHRSVTRSLMFSLICAWTKSWVNNRDVGDLRRRCTYYDVTVMFYYQNLEEEANILTCSRTPHNLSNHYTDVVMTTMAPQITSLAVVYSIVYSGADQRKHQSSASLAFVWGIHRDRWIPRTKGQ